MTDLRTKLCAIEICLYGKGIVFGWRIYQLTNELLWNWPTSVTSSPLSRSCERC